MKVGVYDPYLDDGGGGEKYMMTLASCLSQKHDVSIFWDSTQDIEKVSTRFEIDIEKVNIRENIFSSKISQIRRMLESRKYDALVILSDGSIPFTLSKKLFLHIQQPIPSINLSFKSKIKIKRVNRIFCNSFFTKSFIDTQLGVDSIVIYPPIELHPKNLQKENVILHVGRFRSRGMGKSDFKKQDFMIEVFKKMVKRGFKGWKFVLAVGLKEDDALEFEKLKEKAKNYPIEFMVNLRNNELWELYARAKIYWHASGVGEDADKHPDLVEHFGISTVEAAGAGCVPVVINAGGQKEIVEDNVNGFLWNTEDEFIDKTILLTRENKILEAMSTEAKKRAKEFAGERFCQEVIRLIEK